MFRSRLLASALLFALVSAPIHAACMNKYVFRRDGSKLVLTLLTGKLTFQEAKALDQAIKEKRSEPIQIVDGKGKTISSMSLMQPVRPMPVGCDGKTSGSVIEVTFLRSIPPSGNLLLKIAPETIVTFEQQAR